MISQGSARMLSLVLASVFGSACAPSEGAREVRRELTLDSVPVLDLGDESRGPAEEFSGTVIPVRLSDGTIVVANGGSQELRLFDSTGAFIKSSPLTLVGDVALEGFVTSVVAGLEDPIDPDFARTWIGDTSSEGAVDQDETDLLVTEVLKVPAHVWKDTLGGLMTYDDTNELHGVVAPTLLIWGDGDQLVTEAAQRALLEAIPNARLAVYAGAGHAPRWDERQRFADDVAAFTLEHLS